MNDPHVERLRYKLVCAPGVDYDKAPPFEHEETDFKVRLADGEAVVEMKAHFASEEGAKAVVDPFVRAWEVAVDLQYGPGDLRFKFVKAEVIDRAPTPGVIGVMAATLGAFGGQVNIHLGRNRYPSPIPGFEFSSEVQEMVDLYRAVRPDGERLSVVAYHCLTILEDRAGNRRRAATMYDISGPVLDRLGHLTSDERGSPQERRKAPGGAPYTPDETRWLHAAIRMLIRRAGEHAAARGGPLPQITMTDLP